MSGFQQPISIFSAIQNIVKKSYLLPAFQREFVWSTEQIETLFDSIMRDYPISSMLFWRVEGDTKTRFKFYNFIDTYAERYKTHNELMNTNGINDFYAILDGQQRLTALYIGLCGSYAYHKPYSLWEYNERSFPKMHLYFNISHLYNVEEDIIKYKFKFLYKKDTNEKEIYIDKNNEKWFKVAKIMDICNGSEDLDDFQEKHELTKQEKKMLRALEKSVGTKPYINYYLEDEQDPDKAVNIFVRINSGGSELSFSDILFSMATASWEKIDARTEINNLTDTIKDKGFEDLKKDYILKSFLYLHHNDITFKIQNFNEKFISQIEDEWNNIRDAILSLFDLLKSFGLNGYTLTSYNATLPILHYIYHRKIFNNFTNTISFQDDRKNIKKWLLKVLVRRTFGGNSDSTLLQSRKAFTNSFEQYKINPEITSFPFDRLNEEIKGLVDIGDDFIQTLLETQKDNKFCFSILASLYPDLDYKNGNFHKDHMHPKNKFKELEQNKYSKYDWKVYNSILNLQMLNSNENESKNDKALEDWVDLETKNYDLNKFKNEHLIPQNISLKLEDFDTFIEERKKILTEKLKSILNK